MSNQLRSAVIRRGGSVGVARSQYRQRLCVPAIFVGLGLGFTALRFPAAWLIAAMVCAAITALMSRREVKPPAAALAAAQGVIGVMAVAPLTTLTRSDYLHYAGCAAFS